MKQINKSEIKVFEGVSVCYAVGPAKVCDQLLELGARKSVRTTPVGARIAWSLPISELARLTDWYNKLPEVIEVAYYIDRVKSERKKNRDREVVSAKPKRIVQKGVRAKIGDILISFASPAHKDVRAFQVVELVDGNAIVREINVRDGEPVPNDWKFNDYLITPQKRTADGRPLKLYKK